MSVTYLSCARDQHSPFPPALWCGLCGENVCGDVSPFTENDVPISCMRTAGHGDLHRGGGIRWARIQSVQGAGIVQT